MNKQYSDEEYESLREKIIRDMNEYPYTDAKSRVWKYGEFFPYDLSFFDYNESSAMTYYYPLKEEEVISRGWRWRSISRNEYQISKTSQELPDNIKDAEDSILREIIECAECKKAFRIIPAELELLRRFGLPLPRFCPDCRHQRRLLRLNPPNLWRRTCKNCGKEIITSYAPDRPEIVYCEQCYQAEVQ